MNIKNESRSKPVGEYKNVEKLNSTQLCMLSLPLQGMVIL